MKTALPDRAKERASDMAEQMSDKREKTFVCIYCGNQTTFRESIPLQKSGKYKVCCENCGCWSKEYDTKDEALYEYSVKRNAYTDEPDPYDIGYF